MFGGRFLCLEEDVPSDKSGQGWWAMVWNLFVIRVVLIFSTKQQETFSAVR
jgi:hypothetical protein